jgi:hypothetical protein
MLNEWKESFISPQNSLPKIAEKANLKDGLQHLFAAHIVTSIIYFFAILFNTLMIIFFHISPETIMVLPIFILMIILIQIMLILISNGIIWLVAKLLGGKGGYGAQLHMTSAPLALTLIISGILTIIPFIGPIMGIVVILYYLYPMTLAIRETHKFSTLKAVLSWLILVFVYFFILLFLILILMLMRR